MQSNKIKVLFALLLIVCTGQAAFAERTLESVEEALGEGWSETSGIAATMRMTVDVSRLGIRIKSDASGPIIIENGGEGVLRYRSEIKGEAEAGPFGLLSMDMDVLAVSDGKYRYSEERKEGGKIKVTKALAERREDSSPKGGDKALSSLREENTLRLMPDQAFDGRPVYVLEARPLPGKDESKIGAERMLIYFDKATGFMVRTLALNKKGKRLFELAFTGVRANPDIEPGTFAYTIPPGAEVVDKTKVDESEE